MLSPLEQAYLETLKTLENEAEKQVRKGDKYVKNA